MAKLSIDGTKIEVPDGTRLFDACTEACGEPLPHFCYHPDLSIAGVCRLCQVEIEGMPKLTIACNTVVKDGMVVQTKSEKVQTAVRRILEMHLINHPVDCPICDQAGECGLQNQYMEYGLYQSEVEKADKVLKAKAEVIGPHVILDKERCVLCARCTRFLEEVTGTRELGIFNRGDRAEIGVAPGKELNNNYSLNTVDICPVGALTSRDFRFQKRVWLLRSTPSICPGCATGCNVRVDHEAGRIYRLKPRRNEAVNGPWMCDIGRMEYKRVHSQKRLTRPLLRQGDKLEPISWRTAFAQLLEWLGEGAVGLALASAQQTLEELTLFRSLFGRLAGPENVFGGIQGSALKEEDGLLLAADRTPNRRALGWLDLPEIEPLVLAEKMSASGQTVLIYGSDPFGHEPPADSLGTGSSHLVYWGTHINATAEVANLVIPTSTWAEKDGLFVNRQGRIQPLWRAVARPVEAREDWRLLTDLMNELTGTAALAGVADLRKWVAAELDLPPEVNLKPVTVGGLGVAGSRAGPGGR